MPQNMKIGVKLPIVCNTQPAYVDISMPPAAPANPPRPTTDPCAQRGKRSAGIENRFAEKPWWPAHASPIKRTPIQGESVNVANETGSTMSAEPNIASLRARPVGTPRINMRDEAQPPRTEPISAAMYTATNGGP